MALIEFVQNYEDLSTDMGYQFKFHCDRCRNGHMSRFQPSAVGVAGAALRAAGNIFGGVFGSAGGSAYEVQRAVGGKAHDDALNTAVQEGKQLFKQCGRCGKWVCPQVCFNHQVGQCNDCAPNYQQEFAAAHAQAKVDAARSQLQNAAAQTDYVQGVDMRGSAYVGAPQQQYIPPQGMPQQQMGQLPNAPYPGGQPQDYRLPGGQQQPQANPAQQLASGGLSACTNCGMQLGAFKFCPGCGTPRMQPTACKQCGTQLVPGMKFCGGCGGPLG
jgi:hypothetical protein